LAFGDYGLEGMVEKRVVREARGEGREGEKEGGE